MKPSSSSSTPTARKRLTLVAGIGCCLIVWLVVLPWVGRNPIVRAHVERLQAADVNASAMFYTELECKYLIGR